MSYELDCKWHFSQMDINSGDEGPNSAMSQTFVQFPCSALVRESIQNSLDAKDSSDKPVIVCFEYGTFEKNHYTNFFDISKHIQACKDYFSKNKSALAIYPAMLDIINSNKIGYIRVSDYNTKGMDFKIDDTDSTFYAFVRSAGVSVKKAEGAGGSFGFGKGAFFVMSPINTLIVSSCTKDGARNFEGVTRLCTHAINGIKYSHIGFYDNNGGQPTNDYERIPLPFHRNEPGTSIGIMGISKQSWEDSIKELTKEVLSNFFVAILRGKLVVYINGNMSKQNDAIIIDDSTIKSLMDKYFPNTKDVRTKDKFNPRPYYEAITSSDTHYFEYDLPTLGHVELYAKEFDGNITQFIYMRKPLMKVKRESKNLGNYNGVFICENEDGNIILGDMENPQHNMWDRELCKKTEVKTDYQTACKAEEEIESFVNDRLEELLNINSTDSVQVSGLEKYLPSSEGENGKGEKGNPFTGRPTGKYVKEGSSLTTEGSLKPDPPQKNSKKGIIAEIENGTFEKKEGGSETGGTNGNHSGGGGNHPGPGDNYGPGEVIGTEGSYKRLIEVEWRPVQSIKRGYTDIIIYPPKDVAKAELKFQIGREKQLKKENKEDVCLASTNKGVIDGLTITEVPLKANSKNIIQVSFSDKMYHSLILAVYEIV